MTTPLKRPNQELVQYNYAESEDFVRRIRDDTCAESDSHWKKHKNIFLSVRSYLQWIIPCDRDNGLQKVEQFILSQY